MEVSGESWGIKELGSVRISVTHMSDFVGIAFRVDFFTTQNMTQQELCHQVDASFKSSL